MMTDEYVLPQGNVGLTGPVETPAPGTLPLRGDLAHIALAGRFLVAYYVVPIPRTIGADCAALRLTASEDADLVAELEPGSLFEALDYSGQWCWGCCGPDGPTGYVAIDALAD